MTSRMNATKSALIQQAIARGEYNSVIMDKFGITYIELRRIKDAMEGVSRARSSR